jgi:hypothetical protein
MIFIIGTGNIIFVFGHSELKYEESDVSSFTAQALAKAIDTPKIAFAPNFALFFVPSKAIRAESNFFWSNCFPEIAFEIIVFTLFTALVTPLPPYLF